MEVVSFLRAISEASGVSGYEDEVRRLVKETFAALSDEVRTDAMGNLIALKRGSGEGPRRRVMLAGHMDEIGLMVTQLEQGFLRFTRVGGFDVRTLLGQEVVVHGRTDLPGVIGSRPPHVLSQEERKKPVPMDKLFIDVGLPQAALEKKVRVGDLVTIRRSFIELENGRVCGKGFDDRAGVAMVAVCLDYLQTMRHEWDVFGVATVQEEVGLRGAFTSTYGIAPDVGIAIDVGFGKQPGVSEEYSVDIGKGPALAIGPHLHPAVFGELKRAAETFEIPLQVTVEPGRTGTDAGAIQITREGIPTALLSVPARNMHTPIETMSVKDVVRTGRLMACFIAGLDEGFMDKLAWKPRAVAEGEGSMTDAMLKHLKALSEAFGPSGCEDEVRQVVIDAIDGKVDEWHVDHLGNVIALQKGATYPGFKVMAAAHMDEIGLMITYADDSGLLHFTKVGGIDDRVLPAKVVRIGERRMPGVICIKPVHMVKPEERNKVIGYDQLVIDIGATSKEEAEKLVNKGDYAAFDSSFEAWGELVKGKSFDDRAGCALLISLIERGPYPFDFYPVFTTMEEVGLRGARVAGYSVMPDAAFVFEGTICDDGPKERDVSPTTEVGKGPAISVMDRSVIADRRLVRLVLDTAEAEGIACQIKQPGKGGTDAGAIHLAKTGVPSVPVSVPSRYIHSPVSVLGQRDFEQTVDLMAATFQRLTPDVVGQRE